MVRLADVDASLSQGLGDIRRRFDVPAGFSAEVMAEADRVTSSPPSADGTDRIDRTDVDFVALDPVGSTDLDQAFTIESAGSDLILRYAIADVGSPTGSSWKQRSRWQPDDRSSRGSSRPSRWCRQ